MLMCPEMEASLFRDDVIEGLTDNRKAIPKGLLQELKEFKAAWDENDGLLAGGGCADLLQVSKQRWNKIKDDYCFKCYEFQGIKWYSRSQLEFFYKQSRKAGSQNHDGMKILKSILADANK